MADFNLDDYEFPPVVFEEAPAPPRCIHFKEGFCEKNGHDSIIPSRCNEGGYRCFESPVQGDPEQYKDRMWTDNIYPWQSCKACRMITCDDKEYERSGGMCAKCHAGAEVARKINRIHYIAGTYTFVDPILRRWAAEEDEKTWKKIPVTKKGGFRNHWVIDTGYALIL